MPRQTEKFHYSSRQKKTVEGSFGAFARERKERGQETVEGSFGAFARERKAKRQREEASVGRLYQCKCSLEREDCESKSTTPLLKVLYASRKQLSAAAPGPLFLTSLRAKPTP
eukprot:3375644-Amphidinium_carterae.1